MTLAMGVVGIAMLLAAAGLALAYRSRPGSILRVVCPHCGESLWLPLRVCPLCGADLESKKHREAIALRRKELKRKKRGLLHRSQILLLLAGIVLLLSLCIERIWP